MGDSDYVATGRWQPLRHRHLPALSMEFPPRFQRVTYCLDRRVQLGSLFCENRSRLRIRLVGRITNILWGRNPSSFYGYCASKGRQYVLWRSEANPYERRVQESPITGTPELEAAGSWSRPNLLRHTPPSPSRSQWPGVRGGRNRDIQA